MIHSKGGNSSRIKISNHVAIKKMIYEEGPITRAEISKQLGLTLPTITTNVNTMIEQGIVSETYASLGDDKSAGRPANPININADAAYFIGVEMRRTYRMLLITDLRGRIIYSIRNTDVHNDYEGAMASSCQMINDVLSSNIVPTDKIKGIGLCCPGIVDDDNGNLIVHPAYNWKSKPLLEDLISSTGFNKHTVVLNNSRARALSTMLFNHKISKTTESFAYLFISAGIACPFIINNGIYSFTAMGIGEIGHMVIDPNGPLCRCGKRGCLEAFASDDAIIEACIQAVKQGEESSLTKQCLDGSLDIEMIVAAVKEGDALAKRITDRAIHYLGLAISNIYNYIHPDILAIEGYLFLNPGSKASLLDVVYRNLYSTVRTPNFLFITPGDNSGALGACASAIIDYLGEC